MFRTILLIASFIFSGVTLMALLEVGYLGLFKQQLSNWGGAQVLMDLVIACCLLMGWIWRDARATGRSPWPYFFITLAAGSFGPLLYLLLAPRKAGKPALAAQ
jgi:hypothetical protein